MEDPYARNVRKGVLVLVAIDAALVAIIIAYSHWATLHVR